MTWSEEDSGHPQQSAGKAPESAGREAEGCEEGMGAGASLLDDRWKTKGASTIHGKRSAVLPAGLRHEAMLSRGARQEGLEGAGV